MKRAGQAAQTLPEDSIMSRKNTAKVIELQPTEAAALPLRARLLAIQDDGVLWVQMPDGSECSCDWLESATTAALALAVGDAVLVMPESAGAPAVVLGRVGRYHAPVAPAQLTLEATESLTLKCGEASVDLRADGKVMVRGEDVLLRAKGTQRIRAGTVSIN
jgi:hypothetical protein